MGEYHTDFPVANVVFEVVPALNPILEEALLWVECDDCFKEVDELDVGVSP